jgi:hypothetical protein
MATTTPGFTEQLPPPSKSGIGMKLKDVWGANADQILTGVSPAMSEEFAFEYERYAELYGLYSCFGEVLRRGKPRKRRSGPARADIFFGRHHVRTAHDGQRHYKTRSL